MNPVMAAHGVGVPKENRFNPYTLNGGLVALVPVFRQAGVSAVDRKL